jgi:hypothetical protein
VTDYNVQSTPYKVLIDKNGKIAVLNFKPSMTAEVDKLL